MTEETKNLGGRPPILDNLEELEKKIDEYFNPKTCPDTRGIVLKSFEEGEKGEYLEYVPHPTITGLALHLGFASRQSIYDNLKDDKVFSYTLKKACMRVENNYEKLLAEKGVQTGAIFALKQMGWADSQVIKQDITTDGKPLNQTPTQERIQELAKKKEQ